MAERQGFEPWEGVTLNGFQDRRFKPLSHLSKYWPTLGYRALYTPISGNTNICMKAPYLTVGNELPQFFFYIRYVTISFLYFRSR
jgi:hypothetical protein